MRRRSSSRVGGRLARRVAAGANRADRSRTRDDAQERASVACRRARVRRGDGGIGLPDGRHALVRSGVDRRDGRLPGLALLRDPEAESAALRDEGEGDGRRRAEPDGGAARDGEGRQPRARAVVPESGRPVRPAAGRRPRRGSAGVRRRRRGGTTRRSAGNGEGMDRRRRRRARGDFGGGRAGRRRDRGRRSSAGGGRVRRGGGRGRGVRGDGDRRAGPWGRGDRRNRGRRPGGGRLRGRRRRVGVEAGDRRPGRGAGGRDRRRVDRAAADRSRTGLSLAPRRPGPFVRARRLDRLGVPTPVERRPDRLVRPRRGGNGDRGRADGGDVSASPRARFGRGGTPRAFGRVPPHPPLRGTFSHKGRRGCICSIEMVFTKERRLNSQARRRRPVRRAWRGRGGPFRWRGVRFPP